MENGNQEVLGLPFKRGMRELPRWLVVSVDWMTIYDWTKSEIG